MPPLPQVNTFPRADQQSIINWPSRSNCGASAAMAEEASRFVGGPLQEVFHFLVVPNVWPRIQS